MKKVILSLFLVVLLLALVSGAALAQGKGQTYTVQADDWMSKVAEKYLGDLFSWPAIWAATNAQAETDKSFKRILDPNVFEFGKKFYIPTKE